jgi:membrane protease YdiL (CAAX protease family)
VTSIPPPSVDDERDPRPRPATRQPSATRGAAGWPWWSSFAVLFGAFVTLNIIGIVVAAASGDAKTLTDPSPALNRVLTGVQELVFIGAAVGMACLLGRPTAADFGLVRPPRIGRALRILALVGVGFYAFGAAWSAALGLHEKQDLPDRLGANGPTLAVIGVIVLITVFAPLAEEILFRGYIYAALRNLRGIWPAAIVTGILFGLVHAGSAPVGFLVPLGVFGFGLCLLREFGGSLYPCMALHALNNSIALGFTLHYDWQIPVMMVGSVIAVLALATLLARLLGREDIGAAPVPAT